MKKILVATDGSDHSEKTIGEAIKLAQALDGDVTVMTVMEDAPNIAYIVPSEILKDINENYRQGTKEILNNAVKIFQENGIGVKTIFAKGHPADEICKAVEVGEFDIVILGSRGLGGIQEMLLGSVSNKVAHCVKTHVLIVK